MKRILSHLFPLSGKYNFWNLLEKKLLSKSLISFKNLDQQIRFLQTYKSCSWRGACLGSRIWINIYFKLAYQICSTDILRFNMWSFFLPRSVKYKLYACWSNILILHLFCILYYIRYNILQLKKLHLLLFISTGIPLILTHINFKNFILFICNRYNII